jgi:hypothetical protein
LNSSSRSIPSSHFAVKSIRPASIGDTAKWWNLCIFHTFLGFILERWHVWCWIAANWYKLWLLQPLNKLNNILELIKQIDSIIPFCSQIHPTGEHRRQNGMMESICLMSSRILLSLFKGWRIAGQMVESLHHRRHSSGRNRRCRRNRRRRLLRAQWLLIVQEV